MEQIKIFVREYFNFLLAYMVITYYFLQFLSNGDTKYSFDQLIQIFLFMYSNVTRFVCGCTVLVFYVIDAFKKIK